MPRLLFEKTGNAVWISHLDLMRVFQRAFKRAGLPLKHTQGYNPRPSVSIALPLSVGVSSVCELLDFDLDGVTVDCDEIKEKLNRSLIAGVRVLDVYGAGKKIRELSFLHCRVEFEYDNGVPEGAEGALTDIFSRPSLIVPRKSKNGMQDQDIIPMIRQLQISRVGEKELHFEAVICCQNPTLNPAQLAQAVSLHLPEMMPDFSKCTRLEIFDNNNNIFR